MPRLKKDESQITLKVTLRDKDPLHDGIRVALQRVFEEIELVNEKEKLNDKG